MTDEDWNIAIKLAADLRESKDRADRIIKSKETLEREVAELKLYSRKLEIEIQAIKNAS